MQYLSCLIWLTVCWKYLLELFWLCPFFSSFILQSLSPIGFTFLSVWITLSSVSSTWTEELDNSEFVCFSFLNSPSQLPPFWSPAIMESWRNHMLAEVRPQFGSSLPDICNKYWHEAWYRKESYSFNSIWPSEQIEREYSSLSQRNTSSTKDFLA